MLTSVRDEWEELGIEMNTRGISRFADLPRDFLKPYEEKLAKSRGELVVAIHRYEEDFAHNKYSRADLHVGVVGPKTIFPVFNDFPTTHAHFLEGVQNPFVIGLNSNSNLLFQGQEDGKFYLTGFNGFLDFWFMDRPLPENPDEGVFHEEPRLRIYIGNSETIPILEDKLTGYQYIQLENVLGGSIPESEKMRQQIEDEQYSLVMITMEARKKLNQLIEIKNQRIRATRGGAAFSVAGGLAIEFADEVSETLRWGPHVQDAEREYRTLITTARARGYLEWGRDIHRQIDEGVICMVDVRTFFRKKLEKLAERK